MFRVLMKRYGGTHFEPWDDYHRTEILPDCADWFKFTTARNPYSRAVSMWRAMGMERKYRVAGVAFAEFAEGIANGRWSQWRMTKPQHVWHGGNEYDAILHTETMSEDCRVLPFWNGPETLTPAPNQTQGRPWRDEYTGAIAHDIEKWAGVDFEKYGYEKMR